MRPHILLSTFSRVALCGDTATAAGYPLLAGLLGHIHGSHGTVSAVTAKLQHRCQVQRLPSPNGPETVNARRR
jgi:hypothetical protein